MECIERDGIKYPYPVDKDGRKTLHPDAITDKQWKIWDDLVAHAEQPKDNPFVAKSTERS